MDQANQIQQDLISELGLENLPEDKKQELAAKITEVLLKRIFMETMEKLNDEDKEIYGKMVESSANPDEIDNFLGERIPNYEQFIQEIANNFREEMKKQ